MQADLHDATPARADGSRKLLQWQRRLLDLSKRNALVSMRMTKSIVPVLACRLESLEDALESGADFQLAPMWADAEETTGVIIDADAAEEHPFEPSVNLARYELRLQMDFDARILRSPRTKKELDESLTRLYRSARSSMEENGANTLYLTLGALKWYESPRETQPRYAPILLLPVELKRKSARVGYALRLRDDETLVNVTLLEMLRQDFQTTIPALEAPPGDEHGLDIRAILNAAREGVSHLPRWDVVESAFLGTFSFAQFVMWNDLRNRADDLVKSKLVRSLIDGRLAWQPEPIADAPANGATPTPLAADASQLRAINAAATGHSFVLHGPPGTGKSQTITAMIADALWQGKSVLFVAEKRAALTVVKRRLDALGIGPFCLELHSNRARKKDVLEQLEGALAMAGRFEPTDEKRLRAREEALCAELNAHRLSMHRRYPFGASLYEAISRFERVTDAPSDVVYTTEAVSHLTQAQYRENDVLSDELIAAARLIGSPAGHPLTGVGLTACARTSRAQAADALTAEREALADLRPAVQQFCAARGQAWNDELVEVETLGEIAHTVLAIESCAAECTAAEDALLSIYEPGVLTLPGSALLNQWREGGRRWLLPRLRMRGGARRALTAYAPKGLKQTPSQIEEALQTLAKRGELQRKQTALGKRLPADMRASPQRFTRDAKRLYQAVQGWRAASDATRNALQWVDGWDAGLATIESLDARLMRYLHDLPSLRDYCQWTSRAAEAREKGLAPLVLALEDGLPPSSAKAAYLRGLSRAMAEYILSEDATLARFNGTLFEEKVAAFKATGEALREEQRRALVARLSAGIPQLQQLASRLSEVGTLQRAIRSGGRGMSIRRLLGDIPALLPRLCPCILMSPISAAQYLDPAREPFDLLIFDEASQLPTCKAVGALARAKEAVIVGDPKQLPPTAFFVNSIDESEESEDDENPPQDLQSILDDCLALSMPDAHLLWHYRSRHESLIAFSNHAYYGGELYTFPSPDASFSHVRLVAVDGLYDRGGTRRNDAEAEGVVSEIAQRLVQRPTQSLGVVTFSAAQQSLIEDRLNELFAQRPDLEAAALERDEPVFVKNLENVQGDERDVILLSVCYGPDRQGVVSMNFGPLNREDGWRRLNVALTRAREEMLVFSSLRPEQIDLSRTSARGAHGLRAFLEFAALGDHPVARSDDGSRDGVSHSIALSLARRGLRADTNVGQSRFRVDVAVVDPRDPRRYALGIMLDGPGYAETASAYDRDVSSRDVLRGLGWRIVRVYAADWWEQPEKELERIVSALNDKSSSDHAQRPGSLTPRTGRVARRRNAEELEAARSDGERLPYVLAALPAMFMTTDDFVTRLDSALMIERLNAVLRAEAPINERLLVKRLMDSFGVARVGTRAMARLRPALDTLNAFRVREDDATFYYSVSPNDYRGFRVGETPETLRDARDLPIGELANAAEWVLKRLFGLPWDALILETAKALGYSRGGKVLSERIGRGVERLLASGRCTRGTDGRVMLADTNRA